MVIALLVKCASKNNVAVVQEIVDWMKEALKARKSHSATTSIHMKRVADKAKRDETFKKWDEVVLTIKNLC